MNLEIIKEIHMNDFTVLASLPDMGRVGGLVSAFLAESLKGAIVAKIHSMEKPWVSYSDGIAKSVVDEYRIYSCSSYNLLIFTGDSQPQDTGELFSLCNTLVKYISDVGSVRRLYSAGGYLRENLAGAPKVFGVVNNQGIKDLLTKCNIDMIGNEISSITWFNGLILGMAAMKSIDGIGLFGEISETDVPQPLAAKSIVSAFSKLEDIKLDLKSLDRQYETVIEDIQRKKNSNSLGSKNDDNVNR